MDEPIENLYFNWLCAKVLYLENSTPSLRYDKLLRILHETEFVFTLGGDENRAEDGVSLRYNFGQELDVDDPHWELQPCSVLEMLIAFSIRAEYMTDTPHSEWFWEFVDNLDLKGFSDASRLPRHRIHERLDRFMWRQFDWQGRGGLFPLSDTKQDQRNVEIWYQFCDYLVDQDRMP